MKTSSKLLTIDIVLFILHLLLFIGAITLSVLLIAPIFGVAPDSKKQLLAYFFGAIALLMLFMNISMIRKRSNKMVLLLAGASLLWMFLWCLLVSAYDMKNFIAAYMVMALPLLLIRFKYSEK